MGIHSLVFGIQFMHVSPNLTQQLHASTFDEISNGHNNHQNNRELEPPISKKSFSYMLNIKKLNHFILIMISICCIFGKF
jgi:hypothetical protein